jgi:SAM-dependent methyltransferase
VYEATIADELCDVIELPLRAAFEEVDLAQKRTLVRSLHASPPIRLRIAGYAAGMNPEHLELLASDGWRQALEELALPFAFGDSSIEDLGDDVLEVGPGPGLTTALFRAKIPRLTAIELDADLAAALAKRLEGTNVTVVNDDATAMPFADERFTGAAMFTMLHHVPTRELQDRLLSVVLRVLRPGGLLVAYDGVASDDLKGLHAGDTYNPVDPGSLPDRLSVLGYTEIEVRSNSFAWAAHARRPASA